MLNKTLIIAPHPDDEINLAGQIIPYLVEKNNDVYVLYITNGDYEAKIGNKRIQEAINANAVLGIKENNIIFLGYANEWLENNIYNSEENEELISHIGKRYTNSIINHSEYCYQKYGKHNVFTRNNLKNDLKGAISDIRADLIICNDFDTHPDHRVTSLMFDEVMGELINELNSYHPKILKKFAYNGVWKGEKDYYSNPMKKTVLQQGFVYSGSIHQLESPYFFIDSAIRIPAHPSTTTPLLTMNQLYIAAKQHKSTIAWYQMRRVINSDVLYWKRNTDNLLIDADIKVSSGNVEYIRDFKLYDSGDVTDRDNPFENREYAWRPNKDDLKKRIDIKLNRKRFLKRINLYSDFNYENRIKRARVVVEEEEYVADFGECVFCVIEIEQPREVDEINISIIEGKDNCGFTEIELIEDDKENELFEIFKNGVALNKNNFLIKILSYLERFLLDFKYLILFKIKYEINKRINKNAN